MELRFNNNIKHFIAVAAVLIIPVASFVVSSAFADDNSEVTVSEITTTTNIVSTTSSTSTTTTIPPTTTTAPPPTPQEVVNSLTYNYGDPVPAMQAFAIVATARGWSLEQIDQWSNFAQRVMKRESGFCYNLRRGALIGNKQGCVMSKQGPYQDSGFGQLISLHYAPGEWLCVQENICSAEEIISNPWNSMTAFVALIERNGKQPWCYTASLRAGSICRNAPKNPPAIP